MQQNDDASFDPYMAMPVEHFDTLDAAQRSSSPSSSSSSSERPIVVQATNLHKTYLLGVEGVPALRGVTLSIYSGEFIVILGTSGGGKTSLLNLIGTIDKPTKGELTIASHKITMKTSDEEFARLRLLNIGFVFQTFNLIPSMTAQENVELPMILAGKLTRGEMEARAIELLTRVGLGARRDHLPSQLSGGEQQRVTIARAIANKPSILLLDEPTGDLDTMNGTLILHLLMSLNRQENITCIMVTHDQGLKQYAHRVVHMVDGKILRIQAIDAMHRLKADSELQEQVDIIQGRQQARGRGRSDGQVVLETELRDSLEYYPYLKGQQA